MSFKGCKVRGIQNSPGRSLVALGPACKIGRRYASLMLVEFTKIT